MIYSVLYFNLGGLKLQLEGLSPTKTSLRGDGTAASLTHVSYSLICSITLNFDQVHIKHEVLSPDSHETIDMIHQRQ